MDDYTPEQTGQHKIWDQAQPKGALQKAEELNQSTQQVALPSTPCHRKEFPVTGEAHRALRVMKNPDSSWSQHGKTCKVHPVFAAEAVTEAMTICYTAEHKGWCILSTALQRVNIH